MIDHTHNPEAISWVTGSNDHPDFPVQNLPLGVFSLGNGKRRIAAAIGDWIVDLSALSAHGLLPVDLSDALAEKVLNALFALPGECRIKLRRALFALLTDEAHSEAVRPHLYSTAECILHMPCRIGDYTDFYVGIHHATNIGRLFRPDNPLLPNYKHVPIGYHGRASSIRISGEPVRWPAGQRKAGDADRPEFGPTRQLDYELELGVWIAGENQLGKPVPIAEAGQRLGGLCLLNDWSARDFQAWEYQPLGPFLSKNFMTTISPWIITAEALAPFRTAQQPRPQGDPQPLPYLWDPQDQALGGFSLQLETALLTERMRQTGAGPIQLGRGPASSMYWSVAQMIAHHTVGGCNLQPGDLLGTGTISTPDVLGLGSLMELSLGGREPITLPTGETRGFLEDGDIVILSARAEAEGFRAIGFGPCSGRICS